MVSGVKVAPPSVDLNIWEDAVTSTILAAEPSVPCFAQDHENVFVTVFYFNDKPSVILENELVKYTKIVLPIVLKL